MELATIARPYAEALFRVAQKENLDQWSEIVANLAELGANSEVRELVSNPSLTKQQIVDVLLSALKMPDNKELRNFIDLLVENDRVTSLPEIGVQFHELKNASMGIADAEIITAFPMSDSQLQEALANLEKHFHKKLNATSVTVDNSLIGGILVTVGDEVLDLSVRAKLQKMQETLIA